MTTVELFKADPMDAVPAHLRDGLRRYVLHGIRPGHFLCAVLSNDLFEAVNRGDAQSLAGLAGLVRYLFNHVPAGCHGTARALPEWQAHGGLVGIERALPAVRP